MNKFLQSASFKAGLMALGSLIVLLLVFKAGVSVGFRKARFSYKWGENYHRNFGGPREGFFGGLRRGFGDRDFTSSRGAFGSIIDIDDASLVVKGEDGVEKTVLFSDKTAILSRRESVKPGDLKADDRVVVIGSPNEQGQIQAKFIRVF